MSTDVAQQGKTGTAVVPTTKIGQAKKIIDRYAGALTQVMPRDANADTFMGLAMAAIRKDRNLLEASLANPEALILALRECAYLGHVPMRKLFALVPFNDKNAPNGKTIVGIEEYRGVVERMFRAGRVAAVKANVGRELDPVLAFNPTTMDLPRHEYDEFAPPSERGALRVAYAWAVLKGGDLSGVAWLPPHEIARRRASSRSGASFWGPPEGEGPNTERMWLKSAAHALEWMVPTTVEYRVDLDARTRASADLFPDQPDAQVPTDVADWEGEVIEG